jgi:hypothetical protein
MLKRVKYALPHPGGACGKVLCSGIQCQNFSELSGRSTGRYHRRVAIGIRKVLLRVISTNHSMESPVDPSFYTENWRQRGWARRIMRRWEVGRIVAAAAIQIYLQMACAALQCALQRHNRIVPPADKPSNCASRYKPAC